MPGLGARPRAVIFDFNGTLSDDEGVLYGIYAAMFERLGRPLREVEYRAQLVGGSDEAILRTWLGDRDDIDALVQERIARYCALADGATICAAVRATVRALAREMPVAIVSAAATVEIESVIRSAAIGEAFSFVVGADQVTEVKPDPEGYLAALTRLRVALPDLRAGEVLAVEDSPAGIAAAKAAGMACVAVLGTVDRDRLRGADAIVDAIDPGTFAALLRRD